MQFQEEVPEPAIACTSLSEDCCTLCIASIIIDTQDLYRVPQGGGRDLVHAQWNMHLFIDFLYALLTDPAMP